MVFRVCGSDFLDLFRFDDYVFVLAELVAFDDFAALHRGSLRGSNMLLDPLQVGPVWSMLKECLLLRAPENRRTGMEINPKVRYPDQTRRPHKFTRTEKGARAAPASRV